MRRKSPTVWIACIAGPPFLVLAILFLWCFADNHITRREVAVRSFFWGRNQFDANEWRQSSAENQSASAERQQLRGQMLFSLIRTHPLIGMPKEKVTQLLGEPDMPQNGYGIGNQTGLGIDPDVFYVSFDEFGKTIDFRVEQR